MPLIPLNLKNSFTIIPALWTDIIPNPVLLLRCVLAPVHFQYSSLHSSFHHTEPSESIYFYRAMRAECQEKVKYTCFASRMRLLICTQTCRSLVNQHHTPCPGIGQVHVNMLGKWSRGVPREVLPHPDKTALLGTGAEEKPGTKMDLLFFQILSKHKENTTMLISTSLDILKLTQLENSFVHINCLHTRLKLISAWRVEMLQRSL